MNDFDLSTGALRREVFESQLAQVVSKVKRSGAALSLLWWDFDDTQERIDSSSADAVELAMGQMLGRFGQLLAAPMGRMGPDEFCAVVELELVRAEALALACLAECAFVSFGVAQLRRGEPFGNLLDAAETACTRAKQAGRAKVVCR